MNREIPWGRCEASEQNLVGAGAVPEGEARETEESCCWIGIEKKIASALSSLTLARVLRGVHTLWAHSLGTLSGHTLWAAPGACSGLR